MRSLAFLFMVIFAAMVARAGDLEFIDTSIENGSPLWYETAPDGVIRVHLMYDHERDSANRAAGHVHFRVYAKPHSKVTFEFLNLDNVWNGTPASVAGEFKTMVVSEDGQTWKHIGLRTPGTNRVQLELEMPGPQLDIARVEPYRLSDLAKFLDSIRANRLVQIRTIGKTVEGRDLEIIRIGNPSAPHRVFLRARAHPWEPAGNWVVEGLVHRLLKNDDAAKKYLAGYCVYILPMANKDGVARGRTRNNLSGKDLNRNWDKPADPKLAPENAALEKWLEEMIAAKQAPDFALELHNDGNGKLHISRPPVENLERHLARMKIFESLLRKHTWFTEGSTAPQFHNAGTLGEGWLLRYGIDAAVQEFNCNWIAGLNDYASAQDWREFGANLATVFDEYFARIQ